MADNSSQNGTDTIATDELTTLNGGAVSLIKAQRVKVGFGVDASFRDVSAQFPLPVSMGARRSVSFYGRAGTFRTPGRAGTTGQKIFSIHNATGSAALLDVEKISVDLNQTVAKAATVIPPVIRLYRVTAVPSAGTALAKTAGDSLLSSSTSVTVLGDSSADGTSSATALTATLIANAVITQEFAPRMLTAAGYEVSDRVLFLEGPDELVTLRPLEGLVVMLDYTLATQNPITDMWIVNCRWTEYTAAA